MEEAGIMDDALREAAALRKGSAVKLLASEENASAESRFSDVRKLRQIQLQEARETLQQDALVDCASGAAQSLVSALKVKRKRGRKPRPSQGSQGEKLLKHCWACGSVDHRTDTCKQVSAEAKLRALERAAHAVVKLENRVKAKLVTHLKYVGIGQRTEEYENRAKHSASVRPEKTLKELLRMWPLSMHSYCVENELLEDLKGTPCIVPACYSGDSEPVRQRVLGDVSCNYQSLDMDVTSSTAYHS
jgi:hypothetical protein